MTRPARGLLLALLLALLPARADARKFLDSINDADRTILNDLHNGRIVEARPFGANGNTGSLWEVWVEHQGRRRHALLKPRAPGDRDGWARTPMEVAMYKLNRILGMDLVPPSAYRRRLNLPGGAYVHEGALMHWVDDAHLAGDVARNLWHPRQEALSSDVRILSVLGRDADHENPANIIRGKHWADGRYRVAKIDWEACRRPGAYVNLGHRSATWGPVTRFNPHTVSRLRELSFADLKADLGEHLGDGEIRDILQIRDGILRHVEQQRQQRGDQVFLSDAEIAYDGRLRLKRRATGQELAKFERLLRQKGVRVEYVSSRDNRLKGARGQTVLTPGGIAVRIARGHRGPSFGILVEELVHVNQLRSMARKHGGLAALHAALEGNGRQARAIRVSMEAYAKGRLTLSARGRDLKRVQQERRRLGRQARRLGVKDPARFWRAAATVRRMAAPVARPARVHRRP